MKFIRHKKWKLQTLKEICPFQRGFDLPSSKIQQGKFPVVYSNGILKYHKYYKVKGPGVVTGRSGTIGKITFVETNYWPHNTALWVTNFFGNDPKFIYYFLHIIHLEKYCNGTSIPTLNRNILHPLKFAIPPLSEQKKIAKILSTWDESIDKTGQLLELKKKFKKGLMQQLLTGKRRFKGFQNNEWMEVNLKEVLKTIESGSRPKGGVQNNNITNGIPSFGGENITQDGNINYFPVPKVSQEFFNNTRKGKLRNKDILINKDGACTGKLGLYSDSFYEEASINEHVFILRANEKYVIQEYLYHYLLSHIGQYNISRKISGSAQPGITTKFVNHFIFTIPKSLTEQNKIASFLSAVDKEIELLIKKVDILKTQKKGLMQKLLTGKIRVKV